MGALTPEAIEVLESDRLAHLVTLNPDGSPQVSIVWVGIEGGEIVSGHMGPRRKLANVERDPRVSLSIEAPGLNDFGLRQYLVVQGRGRLEHGGAAALLQRLAHTYLGPDVVFPGVPDPPPGIVLRITPERLSGVGPWGRRS